MDSVGRVFGTEAIEGCLVTEFEQTAEGPITIGVDWARYGDYTAVAVLQGQSRERNSCWTSNGFMALPGEKLSIGLPLLSKCIRGLGCYVTPPEWVIRFSKCSATHLKALP